MARLLCYNLRVFQSYEDRERIVGAEDSTNTSDEDDTEDKDEDSDSSNGSGSKDGRVVDDGVVLG